jgi:hypothetical protein
MRSWTTVETLQLGELQTAQQVLKCVEENVTPGDHPDDDVGRVMQDIEKVFLVPPPAQVLSFS